MSEAMPLVYARHVLCVIGQGLDSEQLSAICARVGGANVAGEPFTLDELQSEPNSRMTEAFDASLTMPSFTDEDWEAVAQHDSVAYILSPPLRPGSQQEMSARMLALTAALLREGGVTAAKNESSGLAHGREWWLELADAASETEEPAEQLTVLRETWVKRPIYDGEVLFSSGMHLLGAPDVELSDVELTDPELLDERVEVMDVFADYLLTEERAAEIVAGEGFRLDADAPRWMLQHREDERHEVDDFGYNLAGLWRLSPES